MNPGATENARNVGVPTLILRGSTEGFAFGATSAVFAELCFPKRHRDRLLGCLVNFHETVLFF